MRTAFLMILALGTLRAAPPAIAAELETIPLPPLLVRGHAASAHTQGMEIIDGQFYVTARLESARPKRAILARTAPQSTGWDTWDITPATPSGSPALWTIPAVFNPTASAFGFPFPKASGTGERSSASSP